MSSHHLAVVEEFSRLQRAAVVADNERHQIAEIEVVSEVEAETGIEIDREHVAVAGVALAVVVPVVAVAAAFFVALANTSAGFDAGMLHRK